MKKMVFILVLMLASMHAPSAKAGAKINATILIGLMVGGYFLYSRWTDKKEDKTQDTKEMPCLTNQESTNNPK